MDDENTTINVPLLPTDDPKVRSIRLERALLISMSAVSIVAWIVLLASDAIDRRHYTVKLSSVDVGCVDYCASFIFALAGAFPDGKVRFVAWYACLWGLVLITAKIWVYRGWSESGQTLNNFGVAVPIITTIARLYLLRMCYPASPVHHKMQWGNLLVILKPYVCPRGFWNKMCVAFTWIFLLLANGCRLLSPIVLGRIVSEVSADHPTSKVYMYIGLYAFLKILPQVLVELQDSFYVRAWQVAFAEVAELTYRHVHSLSVDWHLNKQLGTVVRCIDRGLTGSDNLMYYSVVYLFPSIVVAVSSFIVFVVHFNVPLVAAVCYGGFGSYFITTYLLTLWRKKYRTTMNEHDNEMHEKATDALMNFMVVKYFTNEEHEVDLYVNSVRGYQKGNFRSQMSTSVTNVSQTSIIQLSLCGALSATAFGIIHHERGLTTGSFVAILEYVVNIFEPLSYLGVIYSTIVNSFVDLHHLVELLSQRPQVIDVPDAIDYVAPPGGVDIEFKNVVFHYPTQPPENGLQNISFKVPRNTTTALVGSTGSGKSTISHLLFRFYDAKSGKITFNGEPVDAYTQHSIRHTIGMVPQDTVMFNNTIAYNIRYGRLDATDEEVVEVAKKAHVHDFIQTLPLKYEARIGERGMSLSGGERQRLAIARCLLKEPPVVLLDEATSALDNKTERDIQSSLTCFKGRTTVVIAHRLSTIAGADQIIVLGKGCILEKGTHKELLAIGPTGHYSQMWTTEARQQPTKSEPSTPGPEDAGPGPEPEAVSDVEV